MPWTYCTYMDPFSTPPAMEGKVYFYIHFTSVWGNAANKNIPSIFNRVQYDKFSVHPTLFTYIMLNIDGVSMSPVSPIFYIVSTVNSWSQTCSEWQHPILTLFFVHYSEPFYQASNSKLQTTPYSQTPWRTDLGMHMVLSFESKIGDLFYIN